MAFEEAGLRIYVPPLVGKHLYIVEENCNLDATGREPLYQVVKNKP